ncbi:PREDICTED: bidirectional sugar transporter SWEET8-like [Camelina sativa]|uniref:Bidirectional sugar transporter SWEET n=1 Tax=Camelina sativa TaxID=90675 RepID=A0ABM0VVV6_CAMSA|nr:PREDICTED: bidirectional sugar transporter SWEET8-like [Camelina sativa]
MVSAKEIRTIIGIIGTVISSLISLSQLPKFIQIYKKKSVEDYTPYRHVGLVTKYSLWVLYGLPLIYKDGILVTTSNGVGLGIEVIYLVVYMFYCSDKSLRRNTLWCLAYAVPFVLFFYTISLFGIESLSDRHTFIGIVCNLSSANLDYIIYMTYEYVPVWLSLARFINAEIWTSFSLIYKFDIYVLILNGLGMILYAYQLIYSSDRPTETTLGSNQILGCTPPDHSNACGHSTSTVDVVVV